MDLYTNPQLVDFLIVLDNLPADEIQQYEAFTGQKWDPQEVAAAYSLHPGPKWLGAVEGKPVCIAGFELIRPGVWQDWLFSTPAVWTDHWRTATKLCRKVMDLMLQKEAHRLQCVSLASRTAAHRWYRPLGYTQEGILRHYGAHGEDAVMFSRIRNG